MPRLEQLHLMQQQNPTDTFLLYALAMEYRDSDPEKAVQLLETLHEQSPDYQPTYYALAELYTSLERLPEAQRLYKEGLLRLKADQNHKFYQELYNAYEDFLFEYEDSL